MSTKPHEFVAYSFWKIERTFWTFPASEQKSKGDSFIQGLRSLTEQASLQVFEYAVTGFRSDVDFMLWQVAPDLELLHRLHAALGQTALFPYLTLSHHYLAVTQESIYVRDHQHTGQENRTAFKPPQAQYLFVYPFVKTREWYQLPLKDREAMMREHIDMGHRYPSVRIHTAYSFGLDDQEFMLSFEADSPVDFVRLVMDLRGSQASRYTLRDTPIFSCLKKPLSQTFQDLFCKA